MPFYSAVIRPSALINSRITRRGGPTRPPPPNHPHIPSARADSHMSLLSGLQSTPLLVPTPSKNRSAPCSSMRHSSPRRSPSLASGRVIDPIQSRPRASHAPSLKRTSLSSMYLGLSGVERVCDDFASVGVAGPENGAVGVGGSMRTMAASVAATSCCQRLSWKRQRRGRKREWEGVQGGGGDSHRERRREGRGPRRRCSRRSARPSMPWSRGCNCR